MQRAVITLGSAAQPSPETDRPAREFEVLEDEPDDDGLRAQALQARMRGLARQAALDPDDGIVL